MSRLAAQPISIPNGVKVSIDERVLKVVGPKGELSREFRDEIDISVDEKGVTLKAVRENLFTKALLGTYASHVVNLIEGVKNGYEKKLIIEGVGYKVNVTGSKMTLNVGFSHPVDLEIPEGVTVVIEKNNIAISGINKETVGSFASKVRLTKKPEPYKGKGIRYENEVIRRKQGKKAVA